MTMKPSSRPRPAALLAALALLAAPSSALAGSPTTAATTPGATAPAATTPATAAPPATTPASTAPSSTVTTVTVTPQGSHHSSGGPAGWAIALAALAAVLALACLAWALFRFSALEPHWLLSLRHSLAEAQYRASATWAEFADWLRLGH